MSRTVPKKWNPEGSSLKRNMIYRRLYRSYPLTKSASGSMVNWDDKSLELIGFLQYRRRRKMTEKVPGRSVGPERLDQFKSGEEFFVQLDKKSDGALAKFRAARVIGLGIFPKSFSCSC